jgi:hypothetical protein
MRDQNTFNEEERFYGRANDLVDRNSGKLEVLEAYAEYSFWKAIFGSWPGVFIIGLSMMGFFDPKSPFVHFFHFSPAKTIVILLFLMFLSMLSKPLNIIAFLLVFTGAGFGLYLVSPAWFWFVIVMGIFLVFAVVLYLIFDILKIPSTVTVVVVATLAIFVITIYIS